MSSRMEETEPRSTEMQENWCHWCGHRVGLAPVGDASRRLMRQHVTDCPQHPQQACDELLARWRATDDPVRRACADELVTVVRDRLHLYASFD